MFHLSKDLKDEVEDPFQEIRIPDVDFEDGIISVLVGIIPVPLDNGSIEPEDIAAHDPDILPDRLFGNTRIDPAAWRTIDQYLVNM